MRISVRIVSNMDKWLPRIPRIDLDQCFPKGENGEAKFNEQDFKSQCAKYEYVMIGSKDRGTPLAFAAILLSSIGDWMDDTVQSADGSEEKRRKIRARLDRNMKQGRYSFVRIDITGIVTPWNNKLIRGVRVDVTTNDNDCFQRQPFDRDFAMIVADFCKCFSDRYVARGEPPLILTESTQKFLDELHERTVDAEIHERNQKRLICYRNRNGFCAPCRFDCKHYCQGKCVDIKEIKDDGKTFPDDSDCA